MDYKEAKKRLSEKMSSTKYFTKKTFDTILADRIKAKEIAENIGDVQAFYRESNTARTDFYQKNSGAYCQLLSLLVEE